MSSKTFFSCFLNAETHFIWSFIAPVMVIILINIGFFVMAAVRLWQQRKKKTKDGKMDRDNIIAWLKAVSFILLIMGITWLLGILVVDVPALLPVAYIFTILTAFQGLSIFLSVVAFQKSVRDDYIKWWQKHIKKSDKYLTASSSNGSTSTTLPKVKINETLHHSQPHIGSLLISIWPSQCPLEFLFTN